MIQTRNLVLDEVSEVDMSTLYQWRNESDYRTLVAAHVESISYELFLAEQRRFKNGKNIQMIAKKKKDGVPIGVVFSVNINQTDKYAFFNIYIDQLYRSLGYGAEAGIGFLAFLFRRFDLYKAYMDTLSINNPCQSMLNTARLTLEGTLKGHRLITGVRYDLLRYAMYQSQIEQLSKVARVSFIPIS